MAFINIEQGISKAKDIEDMKVLLRQIAQAMNTLHDTKNIIHGDLQLPDPDSGIILKKSGNDTVLGDGGFTKIIVGGVGTSSIALVDLGKTLKGR